MPEFYSKSFLLPKGRTYALGADGTTGYTGALFPAGASALPQINALMPVGPLGATISFLLFNGGTFIRDVNIDKGTIYPIRPSILGINVTGGDVIGFV